MHDSPNGIPLHAPHLLSLELARNPRILVLHCYMLVPDRVGRMAHPLQPRACKWPSAMGQNLAYWGCMHGLHCEMQLLINDE